jgi:hypothetical protein
MERLANAPPHLHYSLLAGLLFTILSKQSGAFDFSLYTRIAKRPAGTERFCQLSTQATSSVVWDDANAQTPRSND